MDRLDIELMDYNVCFCGCGGLWRSLSALFFFARFPIEEIAGERRGGTMRGH
jgi:hypothetical protein